MDRWAVLGAILFGAVFALFAFWRLEGFDSRAVRILIGVFLFGIYLALVAFGTSGRKRTLSLPGQTALGVVLACAIAALCGATLEGHTLAAILGLLLGYTADRWVGYVQLP